MSNIGTIDDVKYFLFDEKPQMTNKLQIAIEKIHQIKNEFENSPDQFDFHQLLQARIISSNTLRKVGGEDLKKWDLATHYIAKSTHENKTLHFSQLIAINSILSGSDSSVRTTKIYSCDEEYLPPEFLKQAINQFDEQLYIYQTNPLIQAALAFIWTITMHPFNNQNGRTARLAADWILIANGFVPICFPSSVSSHVAQTINGRKRIFEDSILKCLEAMYFSYQCMKN